MAENGNGNPGGLNHDPGTFTHNNAADLPGQTPLSQDSTQGQFAETRDEITKAEYAAMNMSEAERRNDIGRPVLSYSSFKAERTHHQPAPELSYETPLPYRASVDAAHFNDQQMKTHRQAMRDQPVYVPRDKQQDSARRLEPMAKDRFVSDRFARAHNNTQSKDRDH